jgi:DNA-binding NarL/FixJ family response regulator
MAVKVDPPRRTVVIADDQQLVRFGLRSLIESEPVYAVIGEAEDGVRAVEMVRDLKPDLVLLDIAMPRLNGIAALPEIRQASARTRVLVVSLHETNDFVMQVLTAGAHGYLPKRVAGAELLLALDALSLGRVYLSPTISSAVVDRALAPRGTSPAAGSSDPSQRAPPDMRLTARQVQVLRLVASGKSMKEIAFDLGLSVKTVETHRAQIMVRLDIHDVPRLVLYAVRQGLVAIDAR